MNKTKGILEKFLFRLLHIQLGNKRSKNIIEFHCFVYFLTEVQVSKSPLNLKEKEFWGEKLCMLDKSSFLCLFDREV